MNCDTSVISFMMEEPKRPSCSRYDSYLKREFDEYCLQKRYEEILREGSQNDSNKAIIQKN